MFPVPVTRSVDLSLPMMVVPHDYIGAATSYVKAPGIGLEIISLNIEWIGGMGTGKTKVAPSVHHQGTDIVLDGNDMGPLIPQLSIVPASDNVLSLVHLITSSCKVTFSAGDVQAEGTPVACVFPLMPMMVCGEPIKVPFGYSVTNVLNTVAIYPHVVDFLAGAATVIATVIAGVLRAGASSPSAPADGFGGALGDGLFNALLGKAPSLSGLAASNAPGVIGGLVRMTGRLVCDDYDAPVSLGVSYNQGQIIGGGWRYTWGSDGSHTVSESGQTAGGLFRMSQSDRFSSDGSHTSTTSTSTLGGHGSSTKETTRIDSQGRVTHTVRRSNREGTTTRVTDDQGTTTTTRVDQDGRELGRSTRRGVREL